MEMELALECYRSGRGSHGSQFSIKVKERRSFKVVGWLLSLARAWVYDDLRLWLGIDAKLCAMNALVSSSWRRGQR